MVEQTGYSWGGAWNDDGVLLFSPIWGPIHWVHPEEDYPGPLTTLDLSRGEVDHRWPQFLPDGKHFLFFVASPEAEHRGTYVSSLAAPEDRRLVLPSQPVTYASPGYLLFAREGSLMAQRFDVERLERVGEPVALDTQVQVFMGMGLFSASNNGVLACRTP